WVLIESLMSLVLFALVISVLNQQNENDFDHIRALKENAAKQDISTQILILRRLKQDYVWLEGEYETGQGSDCDPCAGESLKAWYLSWVATKGVTQFSSSRLLLGDE
ncbi:hypothetical protein A9Q77_12210, partial [Marinomonas sp. 42_23_T18]